VESRTTLLFVRHGHVEGISPERFRGHHDLTLTSLGFEQAQAVAARLARDWKPVALYTSPLRRCLETAAPIAAACHLAALVLDSLVDFDNGEWTWKTYDEIRAATPKLFDLWMQQPQLMRFPGGDAIQDVVARCADGLRFALERHAGRTVVFVTHDSVIRCLLLQLLDMPLSAYWRIAEDPCAINEVTVAGAVVRVLRVNDTGR
jgi:broad specificity phosphatase PhoE